MFTREKLKPLIDLHRQNPSATSVLISGTLFRWMLRRCLGLNNTEKIE